MGDSLDLAVTIAMGAGLMLGYRQARGKDFKVAGERIRALTPSFAGLALTAVIFTGGPLLVGPTAAIGFSIVALGFSGATFIGAMFSGAIPNR